MSRTTRTLVPALAAVATLALGGVAAAQTPVTLPSGSPGPTTTAAPPTTTAAPTTTAPPPAAIITVPPDATRILPAPDPPTRILGDAGTTSTTKPAGAGAAPATPVPSLTNSQVDDVLRTLEKSGASSTSALIEALRPLQNLGMTAQEALALGMGQFPVQGQANWTDDFGDYRAGPPVHAHQGDDLFTAFNTPVRAPVDGVVRFARDEGLGGNAAYVTAADGTYYYMAHLNGFAPDVASGSAVMQGRIVGFAGDSGNAKGGAPHVHFEIHPGGGAAVNPKPIVDGWVAAALARAPGLIASLQPAAASDGDDAGIPQVLVATGLTRRFSAPTRLAPLRDPAPEDFSRAVLGPLTPPEPAPLLSISQSDR